MTEYSPETVERLKRVAQARETAIYLQEAMFGGGGRSFTWSQEKAEIAHIEDVYRGRGVVQMPNKLDVKDTTPYNVENFIHDSGKLMSREVAEATCTISSKQIGGDEPAEDAAKLRQAVAYGWWAANRFKNKISEMVLHLIFGRSVYVLCTTRPHTDGCGSPEDSYGSCMDYDHSDYPVFKLWHPRGAYPEFDDERLVDLMYVETISRARAASLFPEMTLAPTDTNRNSMVEVLHYLTKTDYHKCAWLASGGKGPAGRGQAAVVDYKRHDLGITPVAWCREPAYDGGMEGMLDQAEGMQNYLNKNMTLTQLATVFNVFQPTVEAGVEDFRPGPMGKYVLTEDSAKRAGVTLLGNKEVPQSHFVAQQVTEHNIRGTVSLPASTQGEAKQSIISAAGVQAFAGARNSLIWDIERRLAGDLFDTLAIIAQRVEVKLLDYNKPLLHPTDDRKSYTPSQVFPKGQRWIFSHVYPAGGLSVSNRMVQNAQKLGIGAMSLREFLQQDDSVDDYNETMRLIRQDKIEKLVWEVVAPAATPASVKQWLVSIKAGGDELDLLDTLIIPEQQPAAPAAAGENVIPFPTQPGQAEAQATGLEKGAVPGGGAPSLGQFAPGRLPPSLEQVVNANIGVGYGRQ